MVIKKGELGFDSASKSTLAEFFFFSSVFLVLLFILHEFLMLLE